ncbi:MAG: polysaccharide biosynthesis tyrosine autokinase [Phycisphaerales bacterium]|nr:MAG: polysaccharide biosynthesis tyrosine autokinase [Phycisphaerales bacterium]
MSTTPATISERILPPVRGGGRAAAPNFADLTAILRRRMVLILVLFVLLGGAAGAGFYVWWKYYPTYYAEGFVELITSIPRDPLSLTDVRLADREQERFVQTQSYLVKNPEVIQTALRTANLQNTAWYKSVPKEEREAELIEDLISAPVRGTNYMRVAVRTRSIDDPHVIVEEVVNRYLDHVKDRSTENYREDKARAQEELDTHRQKLADKRRDLRAAAERLPGGFMAGGLGGATREAYLYTQQVAALRLQLAQLESLRAFYAQGARVTAEDAAAVEADPYVQQLAAGAFAIQQQIALNTSRYGPRHEVMRRLDGALKTTEETLRQTREQKLNEYRAAVAQTVESAYQNMQFALLSAMENLQLADATQRDYDRALNEYAILRNEVDVMAVKEIELEEYVSNLDRLVRNRSGVTIKWAQHPVRPLTKSTPTIVMLPLMILLALLASMGAAVGLDLLNTSIRTTQDVTRHLEMALLGFVPDRDDEEVHIRHLELAVVEAPRSMVAEAFRQIRANLQFSAPAARQRTVAVTSPSPDDGKTTVACNLAAAVAQAGRRVLLIDANLRRPALHVHFEARRDAGLSNILVGQSTFADCVVTTDVPNLDVLYCGQLPPNPAELLGSEPFSRLLADAAGRYDQIIIDTAPVLLASDASLVASAVDGVIFVVRANVDSRGAARRACSLLAGVSAHFFGAVLNAAQVTRGGYLRQQLRSYYDYQSTIPAGGPPVLPKPEGKKE